jgi:mRNA interferase HigB
VRPFEKVTSRCPPFVLTSQCAVSIGVRFVCPQSVDSKAGHRDHKSLKNALDAWFAEVQKADWKNTGDVKRSYTWASIFSSDRVVFDILTNRYRLVTAVDFEKGIVWIKWIVTHKEYDKIDVKKVKHARH